ncbi:isocitrate dehydrogenase [NAD] subunit gamma, mitochondrial isoform X4 [Phocoena sinus]|nr:isocitrate dehydrogenase [NAD] subunit gamma, mitochondrial isoform X4 [Phocoena sinus]
MPAPPSPLLCRGKKRATPLNTRSRRGSATRKRPQQPIRDRRAGRACDVASGTDVSPPRTRGPAGRPPPQDGDDGGGGGAGAAAALSAPEEGVKTGAAVCVLTAGPRPLPGLRARRTLARAASASRNLRQFSLYIMALKVATAAAGAVKAVLRPALLCRPWEVLGAHEAPRRSFSQQTIPPSAKYGGRHTVTMIPGDGIGPELMLHVKSVFRHACVPVDFEEVHVSSNADEEDIRNAIMAIRRNRVALKGNIETNHNLPPSHKSRNNILRTSLDLYANVIHCKSLPGVVTRHRDIDILIVRENTEGEYSSLEHESVAGVVESLKIITEARSLRIAEYAFMLARESGRKKVTAVHKANIMKLGDGLFLQCCRAVAARYPQITFENMIVDNTTMQATRNTGKSIANRNIANPTATLLASCMMLDHLKLHSYATSIRKAVLASMDNENMHTPDIGGRGTTSEAIQDIIRRIRVINGRAVEA